MTKAIAFYLDGMTGWAVLSYAERVWVWVNRPEACPAKAALDMMSE